MLKTIHANGNKPTAANKTTKKTSKQENKPHAYFSSTIPKSSSKDKISIPQSSSKINPKSEHTFKYQLLSAENNIITLKKIKSIPV